jgi:hypothetical protein
MLVADLSHFDGADPERYPAAFRIAERLRAIVRAGTSVPSGYRLDSALRCHRRPGRRVCPGHLQIVRQDVPAEIVWRCSSCRDDGVVRGWQRSPYDLRPPRDWDTPLTRFELEDDELDLLRRLPMLDRESERIVYGAYREGGRSWLSADAEELTQLAGLLSFAARNEADDRLRRRLGELARRLGAGTARR